jgi:hypothetical protein
VPENFRLETVPVPALAEGEVLIRNHYLSLDPYMRGRMSKAASYAASQAIDDTMIGGTVGQVVASRNAFYQVGDYVNGMLGWAEMGVSDGLLLRKLDTTRIPLSAFSAWSACRAWLRGMASTRSWKRRLARPWWCPPPAARSAAWSASGAAAVPRGWHRRRAGEVRLRGRRTGLRCLRRLQGRQPRSRPGRCHAGWRRCHLRKRRRRLPGCSAGRTNAFARIALCGLIGGFNGADMSIKNTRALLLNRLTLRGFIITEHMEYWQQGLQELAVLVANKQIKYRETVAEGLDAAPQAFIGLLQGHNFGKQLVKLI